MHLPRTLPLSLLPIHAPRAPDHYRCSPAYGTNIESFDCQFIVDTYWPKGNLPIHYYFQQPAPSNAITLPVVSNSIGWESSCQVAIEAAGPHYRYPAYIAEKPNMMRALAGYVIQKCAAEGGGMGGFVTVGLQAAENYLSAWAESRDGGLHRKNGTDGVQPPSGAFMTISVNGKNRTRFAPGDTDPDIAGYLSKFAALSSMLYNEEMVQFQTLARFLRSRTMVMTRGSPGSNARFWWDGAGLSGFYDQIGRLFGSDSGSTNGGNSNDNNNNSNDDTNTNGHFDGWTHLPGPNKNSDGAQEPQGQQPPPEAKGQDQSQAGSAGGPGVDEEGAGSEGGEMTYLCDSGSNGGSTTGSAGPDPIDCEKLSWSGLPGSRDPDSILTLEGTVPSSSSAFHTTNTSSGSNGIMLGKPLYWSEGTCTLAVFATIGVSASSSGSAGPGKPTTITWKHVMAAFETLTNLCVANPLYPGRSRGGEAYWGQQSVGSWIHGKKMKKNRRRGQKQGDGGKDIDLWKREEQGGVNQAEEGLNAVKGELQDMVDKPPKRSKRSNRGRKIFRARDGVDGVDGAGALPPGVNVTVFRTGAPQPFGLDLNLSQSQGQGQCGWIRGKGSGGSGSIGGGSGRQSGSLCNATSNGGSGGGR